MSRKQFATVLAAFMLFTCSGPVLAQDSVLVANANSNDNAQLNSALGGFFSTVDNFNLGSGAPTLDQLNAYDTVLVYTNFTPSDPVGTGDVLADYIDAGGCVVMSTYAFSSPWSIAGRIMTSGYSPLLNQNTNGDVSGGLNPLVPGDPIFDGIDLGALVYFHNSNFAHPGLDAGATLLADDGNGINMVARNGGGNVIGINMFPADWGSNNDELFNLYANAAANCSGVAVQSNKAQFQVVKNFTDGKTDEVEVTLSCTGGFPLEQSHTIKGGDPAGVTFPLIEIPPQGVSCAVTESGVDNYTTIMNGGDGCEWTGVTSGYHSCVISNEPLPGSFTVTVDWMIGQENEEVVDTEIPITIWCDAPITPGAEDSQSSNWLYETTLADGESDSVSVDTSNGDTLCWATYELVQAGAEGQACDPQYVSAGGDANCTITASIFFEGIPTLNRYSLAILILLTLGVGAIGMRRFT